MRTPDRARTFDAHEHEPASSPRRGLGLAKATVWNKLRYSRPMPRPVASGGHRTRYERDGGGGVLARIPRGLLHYDLCT